MNMGSRGEPAASAAKCGEGVTPARIRLRSRLQRAATQPLLDLYNKWDLKAREYNHSFFHLLN